MEQTLTLKYGRLIRLRDFTSLPLLSLIALPRPLLPSEPSTPLSSSSSSSHPASQERRSHAADLLCAIWLTSCHLYPRRGGALQGVQLESAPLLLCTPAAHLSGECEKHTGRRQLREEDKEFSGKQETVGEKGRGNKENVASAGEKKKISI